MRSSLIISITLHLLLSLIAFQWVSFREVKYIPRQVYNVTLVPEPAVAQPQQPQREDPPPPEPEPEEAEPEPEPEEEEEIAPPVEKPKPKPKPEKPKPKPRREVPKTDIEQTPPEETTTPDDTGESAPETGDVTFDTDDFPFAPYINRIRRKIAAQWRVPQGSQGQERYCRVYFRIYRNGQVTDVIVEETSGLFMFDQAAQRAVVQASPMPPLPREFRDQYLGVHFSFAYRER